MGWKDENINTYTPPEQMKGKREVPRKKKKIEIRAGRETRPSRHKNKKSTQRTEEDKQTEYDAGREKHAHM